MKKRIISAVIVGALALSTVMPAMPAFATPDQKEVTDARQKYSKLEENINNIQSKIEALNVKIEPLVNKVEENKKEMDKTKNEIATTQKEVEQTKAKIAEQEEVLGGRLRELYKSGGQTSYLSVILGAESFSDLVGRLDSANRLVDIDKKVVKELTANQKSLDEKVTSLQEKSKKIEELNAETEKELANFKELEKEQLELSKQAKAERDKFDSGYLAQIEREIVKPQMDTLKSSNSSIDDLKSALSQIRDIRDAQIKSPIVKKEINDAIEKGKDTLSKKEAEKREQEANRGSASNSGSSSNNGGGTPTVSGNAQGIINEAYKHLGKPYVWGATGPNSFDCSGFTSYVYRKAAGIDITRTTFSQVNVGRPVSRGDLKPGDLVFPSAGHVGIYVGGGNIIHAPQTGDNVKVSPIWNFYAARRIIN